MLGRGYCCDNWCHFCCHYCCNYCCRYRRPKTLNKLQLKPISKQDNVFKVYYDELHIHFSKDKCLRLQCFDLLLVDIDDLDCSYRFHNFCEHFCQCEYGTSTNKSSQERVTSISDDSEEDF